MRTTESVLPGTECARIIGDGLVRPEFFLEEERCDFLVDARRKKVWAVELDLLREFSEVCERLGLRWFMGYGSLLGAMRHGGFIPWDDDVDVCMPREDYDRLLEIGPTEFRHPYFLQTPLTDPGSCFSMARLRNSNTTAIIEAFKWGSFNQGILLDILCLDTTVSGRFEEQYERALELTSECSATMRATNPSLTPDDLRRDRVYDGRPACEIWHDVNANATRYSGIPSQLVATFNTTPYPASRELFLKEDFADYEIAPFETLVVRIPRGWKRILTTTYGVWHQFPPLAQRGTWHASVTWDPDRSWRRAKNELLG